MRDIRLEENIEEVDAGGRPESHVQLEMERVWRVARRDEADHVPEISTEDLLSTLEDIDRDSPIVEALQGLVRWERENDYHDGAVPAFDSFDQVVERGLEKEWYNVCLYATVQAVSLASAVSDADREQEWLEKCIDLFGDYWEELSPNTRGNVIDAIPDLHYAADEDLLDELLDTFESVAEQASDDEHYELERRILRSVKEVLRDRDRDIWDVEDRIIESYSNEAELRDDSPQHKAILLQEALDSCTEFADEEQLMEWKREMREANRQAIENMPVFTHEPDEEEIEQLEQAIDEKVEHLRDLKRNANSGTALFTLLADHNFVPQLEAAGTGGSAPILEIISRRHMSSEGDAIPDPDDESRPRMYQIAVQSRDNILFSVLRRVFSERIITEGDLYLYLEAVDDLSGHDRAYLTDFIIAFFDQRFAEALHLGIPRLEGLIASELKSNEYETASLQEGYTTPTPLPGLLRMLEGEVDENLVEYLKYRYSDISGEGLRNKVAHGRVNYQHANYRTCLILLYDIFRTIAWLEDELERSETDRSS